MKKTVFLLTVGMVLFFTSCQTIKEINIEQDGSGSYTSTTDMSGAIAMVKMSIPPEKLEGDKMNKAIDTTVALDGLVEKLDKLTAAEQAVIKKGIVGLNMDLKSEKFVTSMKFPFSNTNDIAELDRLSGKIIMDVLKKGADGMKEGAKEEGDESGMGDIGEKLGKDMPNFGVEQYFTFTTNNGVIERKLNQAMFDAMDAKEKEGRSQMAQMGAGSTTLILNLPRAAKKVEGKNINVSPDKKKITIETSAETFMDTPKELEFRIEY